MLTYFKTWIKVVLYAYNGYTNHLADSVQLMLIMSGPDCEPRWGTHTSSYTSRKLSMFRETQKFLLVNYPGRESLVYLPLWWIKLIVITVAMKTRDVLTALESAKIFSAGGSIPDPLGSLWRSQTPCRVGRGTSLAISYPIDAFIINIYAACRSANFWTVIAPLAVVRPT